MPFIKIIRTRVKASSSSLLMGFPTRSRHVKRCFSTGVPFALNRFKDISYSFRFHYSHKGMMSFAVTPPQPELRYVNGGVPLSTSWREQKIRGFACLLLPCLCHKFFCFFPLAVFDS